MPRKDKAGPKKGAGGMKGTNKTAKAPKGSSKDSKRGPEKQMTRQKKDLGGA